MPCGKLSSSEEEVKHDGTILAKAGLTYEDIACKVSFDMTIELASGTKFTGNIIVDLPSRKYRNCRKIRTGKNRF